MRCPTPEKIAFRSKVDAMTKSTSVSEWYGREMKVYACRCGRWHLATVKSDSSSELDADASS